MHPEKKMIMPLAALAALLIITAGYFAFRGKSVEKATEDTQTALIHIGVAQIASSPIFEEMKQGIVEGFRRAGYEEGIDVAFDFQNALGDERANEAIAQKFAANDYTLLISMGATSSRVIASAVKSRPIVFGAVAPHEEAFATTSPNITGIRDAALFGERLSLLLQLVPDVKIIGVIYNAKNTASAAALKSLTAVSQDLGLKVITATVDSSEKVKDAAKSIAKKVHALYLIPDATAFAGQEDVIELAREYKKPLIATDREGVAHGALATVTVNYRRAGEKSADIAVRILRGEAPGAIPIGEISDTDLFINTDTAKLLKLEIPEELLSQAKVIYPQIAPQTGDANGHTGSSTAAATSTKDNRTR
jgi:putative tryptophan/tyrosine transport system substrate-binding protein